MNTHTHLGSFGVSWKGLSSDLWRDVCLLSLYELNKHYIWIGVSQYTGIVKKPEILKTIILDTVIYIHNTHIIIFLCVYTVHVYVSVVFVLGSVLAVCHEELAGGDPDRDPNWSCTAWLITTHGPVCVVGWGGPVPCCQRHDALSSLSHCVNWRFYQ